jgi:hypothetical protein
MFHIDRIDSTLGYTPDNVQVLTCSENSIKGNREKYAKYPGKSVAQPDEEEDPF